MHLFDKNKIEFCNIIKIIFITMHEFFTLPLSQKFITPFKFNIDVLIINICLFINIKIK